MKERLSNEDFKKMKKGLEKAGIKGPFCTLSSKPLRCIEDEDKDTK